MGMAIFGAMIRENIPEKMAGRFQGLRIIGQVLIPGVIGPAISAWALRNAKQIENNDGTFSICFALRSAHAEIAGHFVMRNRLKIMMEHFHSFQTEISG